MDIRQHQFDNEVQTIQGNVIHHQTEALASATAYSKMLQNQNNNLLQLISDQEAQIVNLTNQNLLQAQRIQELESLQNAESHQNLQTAENIRDPQGHKNPQDYDQAQDGMDIFDPTECYEDENGEIICVPNVQNIQTIRTNTHDFCEILNSTPI